MQALPMSFSANTVYSASGIATSAKLLVDMIGVIRPGLFRIQVSLLTAVLTITSLSMQRRHSSSSADSFVTVDSHVERPYDVDRAPASLRRSVSPPPRGRKKPSTPLVPASKEKSTAADVEAGRVSVEDHVAFFSEKLLAARLPLTGGRPRIDHHEWLGLYQRNLNDSGHHFVVHQHDHPVAGTHYDLRLQCNATSSISFAIMYGLPGDPNSRRLNRNATETRVHNLWNHLIETASHETGTMLIWDTGEYEVLPYYSESNTTRRHNSDDSDTNSAATSTTSMFANMSEPEKLAHSFARRKIRLRLHGTRLPQNYTLGIRLTLDNDRSTQPKPPSFKRKRKPTIPTGRPRRNSTSSSSSSEHTSSKTEARARVRNTVSSLHRTASPPPRSSSNVKSMDPEYDLDKNNDTNADTAVGLASDDDTNEQIRLTNAYPGASNTISSIHQRKWYLSLSRSLSGFTCVPTPKDINHHAKTYWVPDNRNGVKTGFERFLVLGRDVERSVVTGRLASDILRDEGVEGYVPRGKWRGVVE